MSAQARRSEWRAHAKPLHVTSKPHVTAVNLKRKHTTLSLGGGPVQNPGSPRWFSAGWDSGLPHSVVSPELDLGFALEVEVFPRGTQALARRCSPPPTSSPWSLGIAISDMSRGSECYKATRLSACGPTSCRFLEETRTGRGARDTHCTTALQLSSGRLSLASCIGESCLYLLFWKR